MPDHLVILSRGRRPSSRSTESSGCQQPVDSESDSSGGLLSSNCSAAGLVQGILGKSTPVSCTALHVSLMPSIRVGCHLQQASICHVYVRVLLHTRLKRSMIAPYIMCTAPYVRRRLRTSGVPFGGLRIPQGSYVGIPLSNKAMHRVAACDGPRLRMARSPDLLSTDSRYLCPQVTCLCRHRHVGCYRHTRAIVYV